MSELIGLSAIILLCWMWMREVNAQEAKRKKEGQHYTIAEVFEMLDQGMVDMDRKRQEAINREEP